MSNEVLAFVAPAHQTPAVSTLLLCALVGKLESLPLLDLTAYELGLLRKLLADARARLDELVTLEGEGVAP